MKVQKLLVNEPTFGSDVEFFLENKETHEIVSAEGIVKGTKYEPFHFDENKYYATSLDNVLAEGNIPPCNTAHEFYLAVEKLRTYIDSTLPAELKTVALPAARLDQKWLQTENAKLYGCDPSLNCWENDEVRPEPNGDNVRSAGFHIHIGYDNPTMETNILLGQACDLFLGIPAVLIEPANERKQVGYGHAGNMRHQPHGFEYRVLSSHFSSQQSLVEWCFNQAKKVVDFVNEGKSELLVGRGKEIQEIINTENKEKAKALVEEFELELI